jgi:hypothetical protein
MKESRSFLDLSSGNSDISILIRTSLCRKVINERFTISERGIWRVQNFTNLYMMVTLTHTLNPCLLLGSTPFQEPRLFTSGVYSCYYLPFPLSPQFHLSLNILHILVLYVTHYTSTYNLSSVVTLNYPLARSVSFLNACIFRPDVSLTPSS